MVVLVLVACWLALLAASPLAPLALAFASPCSASFAAPQFAFEAELQPPQHMLSHQVVRSMFMCPEAHLLPHTPFAFCRAELKILTLLVQQSSVCIAAVCI